MVHNVAKILDFGNSEDAFLLVDAKASVTKTAEDGAQVRKVLGRGDAGHQNVVKVDENPWEAAQHPIHQALECLGGVF